MNPRAPATLDLDIPAGSAMSLRLRLVTKATGEAVPLTDLTPFSAAIGKAPGRDPTVTWTVDNSEVADGYITISVTKADTAEATGIQPWDLIDTDGQKWVVGKINFAKSITPVTAP